MQAGPGGGGRDRRDQAVHFSEHSSLEDSGKRSRWSGKYLGNRVKAAWEIVSGNAPSSDAVFPFLGHLLHV